MEILKGIKEQLRGAPPRELHRRGPGGGGHPLASLHHRPLPARQGHRPRGRGRLAQADRLSIQRPKELTDLEKEIERLDARRRPTWSTRRTTRRPRPCATRCGSCAASVDEIKKSWESTIRLEENVVDVEDIQQVISRHDRHPPGAHRAEREREAAAHRGGAAQARSSARTRPSRSIASAIRRSRTGSRARPSGRWAPSSSSGRTGVGQDPAWPRPSREFLFGDEDALVRIDMSDFMEKHNVSRLVGAPPGYIGYEEGGPAHREDPPPALQRGAARRDREGPPRRVQPPAAGPRGRAAADNLGHTVSFRNTVLIMTSNARGPGDQQGRGPRLPAPRTA